MSTVRLNYLLLEEEIIIEQKEKIGRNPQLDGLNDVQRTIKEVNDMEMDLVGYSST